MSCDTCVKFEGVSHIPAGHSYCTLMGWNSIGDRDSSRVWDSFVKKCLAFTQPHSFTDLPSVKQFYLLRSNW